MKKNIKGNLFNVFFNDDTKAGKFFDILLLLVIAISIIVVLLDSVPDINLEYGILLKNVEWIITIVFTLEYLFRIYLVNNKTQYLFSFYGIVDLLAILPTYLGILLVGTHSLVVIRALRLLRIFRILKLTRYTKEGGIIIDALIASKAKISVFIFAVLTIVIIIGTVIYLVEGSENGFTSIPKSIYWAIVTLTTVGYGDISPQTSLGQLIAGFVMILGYAIIAVPTGIVGIEVAKEMKKASYKVTCKNCKNITYDKDARFCKICGKKL